MDLEAIGRSEHDRWYPEEKESTAEATSTPRLGNSRVVGSLALMVVVAWTRGNWDQGRQRRWATLGGLRQPSESMASA